MASPGRHSPPSRLRVIRFLIWRYRGLNVGDWLLMVGFDHISRRSSILGLLSYIRYKILIDSAVELLLNSSIVQRGERDATEGPGNTARLLPTPCTAPSTRTTVSGAAHHVQAPHPSCGYRRCRA